MRDRHATKVHQAQRDSHGSIQQSWEPYELQTPFAMTRDIQYFRVSFKTPIVNPRVQQHPQWLGQYCVLPRCQVNATASSSTMTVAMASVSGGCHFDGLKMLNASLPMEVNRVCDPGKLRAQLDSPWLHLSSQEFWSQSACAYCCAYERPGLGSVDLILTL